MDSRRHGPAIAEFPEAAGAPEHPTKVKEVQRSPAAGAAPCERSAIHRPTLPAVSQLRSRLSRLQRRRRQVARPEIAGWLQSEGDSNPWHRAGRRGKAMHLPQLERPTMEKQLEHTNT